MRRSVLAVVLAIACLRCHSNSGGGSGAGASVTPHIAVHDNTATTRALGAAAAAVKGGLSSMQYYIREISICKNVVLDGSGTDGESGCVTLYQGPDDAVLFPTPPTTTPDYVAMAAHARTVGVASASRHGSGYGYIDLLDSNSTNTLQTAAMLTTDDAGDYNYGLIYWAYPIKVTATLTTAGGNDLLYTHDGNTVNSTHPNAATTTFASNLSVGPATQALVNLPNAGTWFKFQHPFTITSDDIKNGSDFVVDLAFNPNGIVTGNQNSVYGWPQLTDAANDTSIAGNYITVPFLDLTPVPHRSDETVRVETYQGSITTGPNDRLDIRVELYSITQDGNHTIYGVNTTPLVNAETAAAFAGFGKAAFIQTDANNTISLQDWNHTTFLSGLQRQTAVGGQTNVTVGCTLSGATSPVFAGCTAPFGVTMTCTAITELD